MSLHLGEEAQRLGWTAAELFAVHPAHGTFQIEVYGVLIISAGAERGVDANRIVYEWTFGHQYRPGEVCSVSV